MAVLYARAILLSEVVKNHTHRHLGACTLRCQKKPNDAIAERNMQNYI